MTAPENASVLVTLLAVFTACTGYAAGRLHQWYRMGLDREEAYRDGYDTATRSVFTLAARLITPRRGDRAAIRASAAVVIDEAEVVDTTPISDRRPAPPAGPGVVPAGDPVGSSRRGGRHLVPDELVQGPTYRLPPDRVARARVRGAADGADGHPGVVVPRPRES